MKKNNKNVHYVMYVICINKFKKDIDNTNFKSTFYINIASINLQFFKI